ncbi:MAG: malonyl-[acyl-carrier protein] O-methyltransferase BioC [Legionellales bacterium RIFCSPHIGHO2_12_FULL_35_11]|nr:MAG: malonyl-[acyl-carrier protein] O-methyltransferase BioC [Legionellales bacterium RIFCSPHIGHO2_12_FULL_35_11]
MNLKKIICNSFNNSALNYEDVANVQTEIGNRLFQRLIYLKIQPKYILDLGSGPGVFTEKLQKLYPKAKVFGVDIAIEMLKISKTRQKLFNRWALVNGDMHNLPFVDGQFDLIFSNQAIHWAESFAAINTELQRLLANGGCLMFSTLGPDTLKELRYSFRVADKYAHVNDFLDMHDVGDAMLKIGFQDPVLDMEMLQVHYPSLQDLLYSLKSQGVVNINSKKNKGLTGKNSWGRFTNAISEFVTNADKYPLTYEVVYGHAWKGIKEKKISGSSISIADLKATIKPRKSS